MRKQGDGGEGKKRRKKDAQKVLRIVFPREKTPEFTKKGEIHEVFVSALFARATPDNSFCEKIEAVSVRKASFCNRVQRETCYKVALFILFCRISCIERHPRRQRSKTCGQGNPLIYWSLRRAVFINAVFETRQY